MLDPVIIILSAILVIVGAVGTIAPVLPGVPLCWAGLLLLKLAPSLRDDISWTTIIVLGVITLIVSVLDNILPAWSTRKMGGNKSVVWGASVGTIIGFFFGPVGIIVGPFIGALLGGLLSGSRIKPSIKHASGAFLGFLSGLIIKLINVAMIVFFYVKALL